MFSQRQFWRKAARRPPRRLIAADPLSDKIKPDKPITSKLSPSPKHERHRKLKPEGNPSDINYFITDGLGYDNVDQIKNWKWLVDNGVLFENDSTIDDDSEPDPKNPNNQFVTHWWNRISDNDLSNNNWKFTVNDLVNFLNKAGVKPVNKKLSDFHYDPITGEGDQYARPEINLYRK